MSMHDELRAPKGGRLLRMPLPGVVSVALLLLETAVPAFYSAVMALLIGLLGGAPFLVFSLIAVLCFLSIIGVILCAFGIILRTSFFKWLLISLSTMGLLPLPAFLLYGIADTE